MLDFGCGPVGKSDTLSFAIVNDSTSEVLADSVNDPGSPYIRLLPEDRQVISSPLLPRGRWQVRVVFSRDADALILDDTIVINTSAGPFRVAVRGRAVMPSYQIPKELQFDRVRISCGSSQKIITIGYRGCPTFLDSLQVNPDSQFRVTGIDTSQEMPILEDVPFELPILFTPNDTGSYTDSIKFKVGNEWFTVFLYGEGFAPTVSFGPDSIHFDSVTIGTFARDTITLVNTFSTMLTMNGEPHLESLINENEIYILEDSSHPYDGSMIPGDTVRYIVEFNPVRNGSRVTNAILIEFECGPILRIPINGTSKPVEVDEPHNIVVDSDSSHVGERFTVSVRIDPPIVPGEGVTGLRAKVYVNPKSFYVHRIRGGGKDLTIDHDTTGILTVERGRELLAIDDALLFTLELEGLATGQPLDTIVVQSVNLVGGANARRVLDSSEFEPGIIILTGCDVGRGIGFSKSTAMRTLKPNPARGSATAEYIAARGSFPFIEIYDLTGRPVRRIDLPEGTGEEQRTEIAMTGIPAGTYLLQLRMESERSTILMIIGE